jgi:Collagen triple helix repeat (20 copies)
MLSNFRGRFGLPGMVIAVIALVFAMTGGAYAAKKYVITSTKQISPKVLKQLKGAKGAKGAQGDAGPAGPAGAKGDAGPAGAKGDAGPAGPAGPQGDKGANGTNGTSVVASTENTGTGNCSGRGGSKFVTGSTTTFACTGAKGDKGDPGDPWTAGGTLPTDATETGTFASGAVTYNDLGSDLPQLGVLVPISFNVPLPAPLEGSSTFVVIPDDGDPNTTQDVPPAECENPNHDGAASVSNPEATSGNLCIYVGETLGGISAGATPVKPGGVLASDTGAGVSGSILRFLVLSTNPDHTSMVSGSWAVTG